MGYIFWCFPLHESRCKPLTFNATILTDLWGLSCIDFCELNWAIPKGSRYRPTPNALRWSRWSLELQNWATPTATLLLHGSKRYFNNSFRCWDWQTSKIVLVRLTCSCTRVRTLACTHEARGVWGHAPPGKFFEFDVVRWLLRLFWDPKHHY